MGQFSSKEEEVVIPYDVNGWRRLSSTYLNQVGYVEEDPRGGGYPQRPQSMWDLRLKSETAPASQHFNSMSMNDLRTQKLKFEPYSRDYAKQLKEAGYDPQDSSRKVTRSRDHSLDSKRSQARSSGSRTGPNSGFPEYRPSSKPSSHPSPFPEYQPKKGKSPGPVLKIGSNQYEPKRQEESLARSTYDPRDPNRRYPTQDTETSDSFESNTSSSLQFERREPQGDRDSYRKAITDTSGFPQNLKPKSSQGGDSLQANFGSKYPVKDGRQSFGSGTQERNSKPREGYGSSYEDERQNRTKQQERDAPKERPGSRYSDRKNSRYSHNDVDRRNGNSKFVDSPESDKFSPSTSSRSSGPRSKAKYEFTSEAAPNERLVKHPPGGYHSPSTVPHFRVESTERLHLKPEIHQVSFEDREPTRLSYDSPLTVYHKQSPKTNRRDSLRGSTGRRNIRYTPFGGYDYNPQMQIYAKYYQSFDRPKIGVTKVIFVLLALLNIASTIWNSVYFHFAYIQEEIGEPIEGKRERFCFSEIFSLNPLQAVCTHEPYRIGSSNKPW